MRDTERNGEDYHFVSREEFERMVRDGEMLEHALVYGQMKGVPRRSVQKVLDAGKDALLRTDVQGARYIKSMWPAAVTIFIAPPSREEMEHRLRSRGGDSPEQVEMRLATAAEELDAAGEFDHVVVNDDIGRCIAEIEEIIEAERRRPGRAAVELA
jgi:guanylate kinase